MDHARILKFSSYVPLLFNIPKHHWSDAPMVRRITDLTTHWSEAPLVRRNKISFNEDYKVTSIT